MKHIATELDKARSDRLWRSLAALDRYRRGFDDAPPTLGNALLIGRKLRVSRRHRRVAAPAVEPATAAPSVLPRSPSTCSRSRDGTSSSSAQILDLQRRPRRRAADARGAQGARGQGAAWERYSRHMRPRSNAVEAGLCRALLVLALTPWVAGGPGEAARSPETAPQRALAVPGGLLALGSEAARSPEMAPQAEQRAAQAREPDGRDGVFRTGIELVNVAATVTDARGRFVGGLTKDDFRVYEDGEPVEITQFDNERVPVSLGIALDTSGSMDGRKMEAARNALDRFLYDLLGPDDEIFLYRFDYTPVLLQDWTTSRDRLRRAIRDIRPPGGTALYDAVADSVPRVAEGRHRKKALLIISDGNDTTSETDDRELRALIRENEALVYAIGIDGSSPRRRWIGGGPLRPPEFGPLPIPGRGRRPPQLPRGNPFQRVQEERVNVSALRESDRRQRREDRDCPRRRRSGPGHGRDRARA